MSNQEAAEILKNHIDTYNYQLSDGGWAEMVRIGIARPTARERAAFMADATRQVEAYQMAIKALLGN